MREGNDIARPIESCPICGAGEIRPDFVGFCQRKRDGRDWPISRCDGCGTRLLNPQPTWEELAPYYDAHYVAYGPSPGPSSLDAEIAAARASGRHRHVEIRPGLRLLDVGCGGGSFLTVARALGAEVAGVEPSEHGVRTARAAGLDVFHGPLDAYLAGPGAERRFDLITANHVVEHHSSPVDLLSQMRRLLAPGGRVWFAVPNIESETALALKADWHSVDLPFHLYHFTPASAALAAEKAGLRVVRSSTYSFPHAAFASFRTIWRKRYFLPLRLSHRLPALRALAARRARQMDAAGAGEAILIEATAA